jgi:NADH:ubiquinone oxidoreductase subunit K
MVNLYSYLLLAAIVFAIGLFGVLSRRSLIVILMSLELMAAAVTINLVALARYLTPGALVGQIFAIFVMVVSAAEIGLGLAIALAVYRKVDTTDVDSVDRMRG